MINSEELLWRAVLNQAILDLTPKIRNREEYMKIMLKNKPIEKAWEIQKLKNIKVIEKQTKPQVKARLINKLPKTLIEFVLYLEKKWFDFNKKQLLERKRNIRWFTETDLSGKNENFYMVCNMAGFDPEYIKRKVIEAHLCQASLSWTSLSQASLC